MSFVKDQCVATGLNSVELAWADQMFNQLMRGITPPISPPAALPTTKEPDAHSAADFPFVNSITADGS